MNKVQPLKKVHLSRLSPVMWTLQTGYPRPEISVPIPKVNNGMGADVEEAFAEYLEVPMSGMGASDGRYVATPINPKASPLWSNLYRIGAAGALSRVAPFGPDAFGTDEEPSTFRKSLPFLVPLVGIALFTYFSSRSPLPERY